MANFQTHLSVGIVVVGTAALGVHTEGLADLQQTQWLLVVGVIASLLPDIDAEDSHPVRAFFAILGLALGFFLASALRAHFRLVELGLIWVATWLFVQMPVRFVFARLTVHRGVFHSLLMAAVLAIFTAVAASRWLSFGPTFAWLACGFVLLGYCTHLLLDEIASIDLVGKRVKRSFGTALKPLSLRAWPASLLLIGLLGVGIALAPDPAPLLSLLHALGIPQHMPMGLGGSASVLPLPRIG